MDTVSDRSSSYSANFDRGYEHAAGAVEHPIRLILQSSDLPSACMCIPGIKVAVAVLPACYLPLTFAALFSVAKRFLAAISLMRKCNFTLVALRHVAEHASRSPAEYNLLLSCQLSLYRASSLASPHRSRLHLSFSIVSP